MIYHIFYLANTLYSLPGSYLQLNIFTFVSEAETLPDPGCTHFNRLSSPDELVFVMSLSDASSNSLTVPKLHDDGSNWADYESRIRKVLGAKGVWRHVEGTAACPPKPYAIINGVYVLSDGKTPATEDQIEAREDKIEAYERNSFLAQHIILSMTSYRLGAKIRNLTTAKDMWDVVVADTTTKSTLYLIDAEDQLATM